MKTFVGAMAAIWIAMRIGLDRPYWALATSYIVAQPLTGAMRSKAAYRLLGTFVGLVATLVLVPNLVNSPQVLTAGLALWVGVCIYFAVLDRTPRSYVFLLAGYTCGAGRLPHRRCAGLGLGRSVRTRRGDCPGHHLHHVRRHHRVPSLAWPDGDGSTGCLDAECRDMGHGCSVG